MILGGRYRAYFFSCMYGGSSFSFPTSRGRQQTRSAARTVNLAARSAWGGGSRVSFLEASCKQASKRERERERARDGERRADEGATPSSEFLNRDSRVRIRVGRGGGAQIPSGPLESRKKERYGQD